ncbi:MAG: lipoate--protein ligase family protein [Syntrophaceae bacterium]|nr:lipoate--protein ligase family protein [Syntrophaceae bacterium]
MAVDEALFRVLQERGGSPILRFYGWEKPALSIGYFQNAEREINLGYCQKSNLDIVRRPTGGKAVLHDRDLTYSIVSPEVPPFFSPNLIGNYQAICTCLIRGFAELGIPVGMGEDQRKDADREMGAICFAFPAPFELLSRGRKICGSAQVRSRGCFLQHGSIPLDFDPHQNSLCLQSTTKNLDERCTHLKEKVTSVLNETDVVITQKTLSEVMQRAFEAVWQVRFIEGTLTAEEDRMKNNLLARKYAHPAWNLGGKI